MSISGGSFLYAPSITHPFRINPKSRIFQEIFFSIIISFSVSSEIRFSKKSNFEFFEPNLTIKGPLGSHQDHPATIQKSENQAKSRENPRTHCRTDLFTTSSKFQNDFISFFLFSLVLNRSRVQVPMLSLSFDVDKKTPSLLLPKRYTTSLLFILIFSWSFGLIFF
ncbi:hypothetical protein RDI58_010611 [Solanum bulbocastanum]|uniref:Uncharacterized protein n=1 Tax=Solanum bulbocastanum TaxID=147425 RepID=A0AAN8YG58_SOLBU